MKTRFPPEPNGMLHIGHLKAIVADFEGIKGADRTDRTDRPVCNLRYDDTNPSTETEEYKQSILDDLHWLGFKPDRITSTSDYFPILETYMRYLLENGLAFYEWDDPSKQRAEGAPSPTRHVSGLKYLDPVVCQQEGRSVPCVRVKIAPDNLAVHPSIPDDSKWVVIPGLPKREHGMLDNSKLGGLWVQR